MGYVCKNCNYSDEHCECAARIAALESRLREAEAVIKPFADDDFCRALSGNIEGDKSPVFGRGTSILTLGDFRRAAAFLAGGE